MTIKGIMTNFVRWLLSATSKSNFFVAVVVLIYAVISFSGVLFHEATIDEAQVWLLARDLSLPNLIAQMHFEGTPALWHLIIFPFAKAGFPYIAQQMIHWIFAVIAVFIFVRYAPFTRFTKLSFVFSYYMFFQYLIYARNYNLTILILFIIAATYEHRHRLALLFGLLVFLLFNSNLHSYFMAGMLMLIFIYDTFKTNKKAFRSVKVWLSIAIMISGAISTFLQLWWFGKFNEQVAISNSFTIPLIPQTYWRILISVANSFIPQMEPISDIKTGMFFLCVIVLIIISFYKVKQVFFTISIALLWLFYIFTVKKFGGYDHQGLIMVFIIFSYWLYSKYKNEKGGTLNENLLGIDLKLFRKFGLVVFNICFLIMACFTISYYQKEILYKSSGSKEMADFIKNNKLSERTFVAYNADITPVILAYLPDTKFWYANQREYGSYIKYDEKSLIHAFDLKEDEILMTTNEYFPDNNDLLLLLTFPLSNKYSDKYKLLFHNISFGKDIDEVFYLYEPIKNDKPNP